MRSPGVTKPPEDSQPFLVVVEDESLIRETITMALTDEGYQVLAVEDGRQALEVVRASCTSEGGNIPAIDLLILDLMLPYINGLDLCRLLRQEGMTTPILMLSAKGTETDIVVGLEIGADDYLAKPFGMRELIARCRSLLRRANRQPQPQEQLVIQFQEIVLYPQECRVTVRDKAVSLSPKEFTLLELFMNNPRRVFSRDQLLEKVWGIDFMGDSKTVDVHIRWLREKLELDPSSPQYLITVRGFGYRLG
ncbi:response regulator transcription factor [Leptolyngbya sp. FACHB-321]|uniref:response regulator transcription factor n=1 Tax=Leptolyngbya sp. FACHB-321 TaxID=2692807 RepID=UPI0016857488|nr:response regulator transcription factor [Leptolyngbya sp. FACHB-321]MBD2034692.1 response regulator transcription factor [Leptolyngbya sp. FACHB-321]